MARQRLGQHFLEDIDWREQIARAIGVSPHSSLRLSGAGSDTAVGPSYCWIEVGAGHGEMTEHLLASGAEVYAVELDPQLAAQLQKLAKKFPKLKVIHDDVLETDLAAVAAGRRIRIYGNLPYYITSPILHHFFMFADAIDEIHIVIQEEVAERLAAEPETKQFGYLSVVTQLFTRPELVLRIPRTAFSPPPEVGSALVTLRLPGERAKLALPDEVAFLDFVKLCFSQKRKTLVNNLRSLGETGCRTRSARGAEAAARRAGGTTFRRTICRASLSAQSHELTFVAVFFLGGDQSVRIIAHDAIHSGGHQKPNVGGMIDSPADDLQIALVSLLDHRRRYQVAAHHKLPRARVQRGFVWISELAVIKNAGHQRGFDLAQARDNSRIEGNYHYARYLSGFPQRADQGVFAAPGAAGFQLQIKDDVVLFGKFQNLFESGNTFASVFAAEPGAGIETAKRGERLIMHFALAIGGAIESVVMNGHEPRIARELQVRLDKSRA